MFSGWTSNFLDIFKPWKLLILVRAVGIGLVYPRGVWCFPGHSSERQLRHILLSHFSFSGICIVAVKLFNGLAIPMYYYVRDTVVSFKVSVIIVIFVLIMFWIILLG